jgi:hypothetical protein
MVSPIIPLDLTSQEIDNNEGRKGVFREGRYGKYGTKS